MVNYDGFAEGISALCIFFQVSKGGNWADIDVGFFLRASGNLIAVKMFDVWQILGLEMNCSWTEGWFGLK